MCDERNPSHLLTLRENFSKSIQLLYDGNTCRINDLAANTFLVQSVLLTLCKCEMYLWSWSLHKVTSLCRLFTSIGASRDSDYIWHWQWNEGRVESEGRAGSIEGVQVNHSWGFSLLNASVSHFTWNNEIYSIITTAIMYINLKIGIGGDHII